MGAIRIGAYTNLQDGVICHDTTNFSVTRVGDRVTVGHRVILHGCQIEDDALIGMGAIVMDNAVIGAHCLVGAGALVPSGKVLPPRSLVLGQPARVVRMLTDEEVANKASGWKTYAEKAKVWLGRSA
jgi:carbonic anhydrase/acetyltransferase-like protein (isoleucine patch superfamily)